jgi:hypothetical protein
MAMLCSIQSGKVSKELPLQRKHPRLVERAIPAQRVWMNWFNHIFLQKHVLQTINTMILKLRNEILLHYNEVFKKTKSFISEELDAQCLHISFGDVVFTLTGKIKLILPSL